MAEGFYPADLCEDLTCCVICYEPFHSSKNPKALPCLHTFCEHCLQKSIIAHKKAYTKHTKGSKTGSFPCPVCKEKTKIPDNGTKGFKDDFRIRRISDILSKMTRQASKDSLIDESETTINEEGAKEDTAGKCAVCRLLNDESEATLYCLECAKALCAGCAEKHSTTTVTKEHKIVPRRESLSTEMCCKVHSSEPLKFYCRSCTKAVCIACTLSEEHPDHEIVELIEESDRMKDQITTMLKDCKSKIPHVKAKLSDFDKLEQKLLSKEKQANKAILVRTLEEMSKVKANQAKMEQDLESLCREKYQDMKKNYVTMRDKGDKMGEFCDFTETLLQSGQCLQIVGSYDEIKSNLDGVMAYEIPEIENESVYTKLGQFDTLISGLSSDLGKDDGAARASILEDIRSVASQMRSFSITRSDTKYNVLMKFGKKGSRDGDFNFPAGVAILPNDDIVVADLHNHRLQIFDKKGKFKRKFGADGFKPCGLAITKDGNIAVTDCQENANCIIIYAPDGTRKAAFGFGEFDYPFSLAVDSRGRFIVSDPAINRITILHSDGTLMRRFSTKSKFAFYLTVNNKDEIILSDWFHHCVKIFDQAGHVIRKIGTEGCNDGQLLLPLGVATDKRGNILVLDCKCERISTFSPDGRFVKQLINKEDGLKYSRAMTVSKEGHIIITLGDNRREVPNEVRVYEIQNNNGSHSNGNGNHGNGE